LTKQKEQKKALNKIIRLTRYEQETDEVRDKFELVNVKKL